jgi:hypothetical protein
MVDFAAGAAIPARTRNGNIGHDPSSKPTYSDVSVDKLSGQI